jgi:hypothetical protein
MERSAAIKASLDPKEVSPAHPKGFMEQVLFKSDLKIVKMSNKK